jgi:hypothetical protein
MIRCLPHSVVDPRLRVSLTSCFALFQAELISRKPLHFPKQAWQIVRSSFARVRSPNAIFAQTCAMAAPQGDDTFMWRCCHYYETKVDGEISEPPGTTALKL